MGGWRVFVTLSGCYVLSLTAQRLTTDRTEHMKTSTNAASKSTSHGGAVDGGVKLRVRR